MKLMLKRTIFTDRSTIGTLYIDGNFFCYTLEDVVRPVKIKKETAIPAGNYRLEVTYSPKYKRPMIEVMDIPGFKGIRIHSGNTRKDTEGCILLGKYKGKNKIITSKEAIKQFERYVFPVVALSDKTKPETIVNLTIIDAR